MTRNDLTPRQKELLITARAQLLGAMTSTNIITELDQKINEIIANIEKLLGY